MTSSGEGIEQTIAATDGFELATTIYGSGDDVVMLSAATATPRQFYKSFAMFLADEGHTVVTYDYRGIGESRPESLRGFRGSMSDWGLLDMQGVLDWISDEYAPTTLFAVGHSVGGQVTGMLTGADRITAMATVSAQSGYWGLQGDGEVAKMRIAAHFVMPPVTRLFGYFPWSKFSSAQDLPKDAALQWASWCRDPDYILGDDALPLERYQDFTAPVLAYSIDDGLGHREVGRGNDVGLPQRRVSAPSTQRRRHRLTRTLRLLPPKVRTNMATNPGLATR